MDSVNLENRVILSIAPVGQSEESFAVSPKTAEQVAEETIACARNGAAMVHLHVRDAAGMQTHDLTVFSRTIDLIGEGADMSVQGSTGGLSTLTLEERCVALNDPRVETASLNIGSVNFGDSAYINTLPDARYWARRIFDASARAEMEIFDLGMFNAAAALIREGLIPPPPVFALVFGFEWAMPADPAVLEFTVTRVPPGAKWGVLHHGMENLDFLVRGMRLGASFIRVGYEDSLLGPGGRRGLTNAQLVEAAAEAAIGAGRVPASASEARRILAIPAAKQAGGGMR